MCADQYKTPCYVYDTQLLARTLDAVEAETRSCNNFHVHYAVKANAHPDILRRIAARGLGADCVSGGEIRAALEAGFPASEIVFAGVGKADWEINLALQAGIAMFNVESVAELEVIRECAAALQPACPSASPQPACSTAAPQPACPSAAPQVPLSRQRPAISSPEPATPTRARVSFRINPDVGAHTHAHITTGLAENKFGIDKEHMVDVIRKAQAMDNIDFTGLHFHIGSQLLDMADFQALCERINELQCLLDEEGIYVPNINVGGGLGVNYEHPSSAPVPDFKAYFDTFKQHLRLREGQQLHFELGRSIVAQMGTLLTRVLYVKEGTRKKFVIVDAGMTELIRPALYGAYHEIVNLTGEARQAEAGRPAAADDRQTYDVVGPICESSDVFVKDYSLPATQRGDLLEIRSAGAYGETMASTYNCRPLPKSYLR